MQVPGLLSHYKKVHLVQKDLSPQPVRLIQRAYIRIDTRQRLPLIPLLKKGRIQLQAKEHHLVRPSVVLKYDKPLLRITSLQGFNDYQPSIQSGGYQSHPSHYYPCRRINQGNRSETDSKSPPSL